MTADKHVKFQVHPSDGETEATTWSIADMDRITNELKREIHGITSNEKKWFNKELSICLIKFEAWWMALCVLEIQTTINQHVIHLGHSRVHLVTHTSQSILRMGSGDNFTTDIAEWLYLSNVQEAYQCTNKVNNVRLMLMHNDWCTGLDCMEQTLYHLALQG